MNLSKSDFNIALTCPTKLFYKKKGYPSANDGNDYMEFLADGGHQVGKLATLQFPNGVDISTGDDHKKAQELTIDYLQKNEITLFEPRIEINGKVARFDILERNNDEWNLIEVKSKSYDPDWSASQFKRKLDGYFEDVAFQYLVLSEYLKDQGLDNSGIKAYLMLPDKSKSAVMDGLNSAFKVVTDNERGNSNYRTIRCDIEACMFDEVCKEDLLTLVDVTEQVRMMQPQIRLWSESFIANLNPELKKIPSELSKDCFQCEYNGVTDKFPTSGFDECWKGMPNPKHHIKDLYYAGSLGANKLENEMIAERKLSMYDVNEEHIKGKRGIRQQIQLDNTLKNCEWHSETMKAELNDWDYPLHFIDFETATAALPYHAGMNPYEMVAFQWSCHTIPHKGAEPIHSEWLSLEHAFPNFKFAEALMQQVGTSGTFLMWATHENTTLKNILRQAEQYGYDNPIVINWLETVISSEEYGEGLFVDMNKFTLEHYFQPKMKGRTGLKFTLPAVLAVCNSERIVDWLTNFSEGTSIYKKENNELINPYKLLPPFEIFDKAEQINDGAGAMSAYQDLQFGLKMGDENARDKYAEALLNYCKLDTLAMVIVWEHWKSIV